MSGMSRLEAVNLILSATGDDPVSSLADEAAADTLAAEQRLDAEDREVQTQGWYFNTYEKTYSPDSSGKVFVPGTVLYVDADEGYRYSVQEGVLYDLLNDTTTFTSAVTLTVVERLAWEKLPGPAQQYIASLAARRYADRQLTDPTLSQYLREDEARAYAALRKAHTRAGNFSIFGPNERTAFLRGGPYSL